MSKWANVDALKARIDKDVRKDKVLDGWAFFFKVYLDSVPTIELKQGEWIGEADGYYNGEFIYDTWYCSNCDYVIEDEESPSWNYCPNCGCLMKGKYYV